MGRSSAQLKVFVEFLVLFAAVRFAEPVLFEPGYYAQLEFHPFWMLVLLGAIQYGVFGGLITVLLACIFMRWPERQLGTDITEYYVELVSQPLLWLMAALFFGSYQSLQLRKHRKNELELVRYSDANAALADELARVEAVLFRMELEHATQTEPMRADASGYSRLLNLFERNKPIDEIADAFVLASKATTDLPARLFLFDNLGKLERTVGCDENDTPSLPDAFVDAVTLNRFAHTLPADMIFPGDDGYLSAVAISHSDKSDLAGIVVLRAETEEQADAAMPIVEILGRAVSHALGPRGDIAPHRATGVKEATKKDTFAARCLKFK